MLIIINCSTLWKNFLIFSNVLAPHFSSTRDNVLSYFSVEKLQTLSHISKLPCWWGAPSFPIILIWGSKRRGPQTSFWWWWEKEEFMGTFLLWHDHDLISSDHSPKWARRDVPGSLSQIAEHLQLFNVTNVGGTHCSVERNRSLDECGSNTLLVRVLQNYSRILTHC